MGKSGTLSPNKVSVCQIFAVPLSSLLFTGKVNKIRGQRFLALNEVSI